MNLVVQKINQGMLKMIWVYSETLILVSGVIWNNQEGKLAVFTTFFVAWLIFHYQRKQTQQTYDHRYVESCIHGGFLAVRVSVPGEPRSSLRETQELTPSLGSWN